MIRGILWEEIEMENLHCSMVNDASSSLKIYIHPMCAYVDRAGRVTCPPRMIPSRYTVPRLNRVAMEGGACAFLFRVSKLRLLYRGCIDSSPLCSYPSMVGYAAGSPFFTRQIFLRSKKRRIMYNLWHFYIWLYSF